MKMNRTLAQEITKKVMKVIPYNVNIMDETGLIIGSGEEDRIGTYHQGAVQAVQEKSMVSVYNPMEGTKPGVNIPFEFRQKTIGVIGISGDPHYVAPFAELVRITAELLINQEFLFRERRMKEQLKEEFLYQWMFRKEPYDQAFLDLAEAVDINLTTSRLAVVTNFVEKEMPPLSQQEFRIPLTATASLFILADESKFIARLGHVAVKSGKRVGVGRAQSILAHSIEEAKRALDFSERFSYSHAVCYYEQVKFLDFLANRDGGNDSELTNVFADWSQNAKGRELLDTLVCFIEHNGDMNFTSDQLHIHRNSLTYRLQKIENLTSKNPKKFTDLFELYTGYVQFRTKQQQCHSFVSQID